MPLKQFARIIVFLFLAGTTFTAVEPGLPSKTAVYVAAARTVGSKDPEPLVAERNYARVIQSVAQDIAGLKRAFPALSEFSAAKNAHDLSITYAYHTHKATHHGGWTAGVPNPDDDGLWFYVDFHDPHSTAQIHTQPMTGPAECLEEKRVSLLILTGKSTRPVGGQIWAILQKHGVRQCGA